METFLAALNNIGIPVLFVAGLWGTAAALTVFVAELALRRPRKHWVLLWGPAAYWALVICGWVLANVLYGAFAP